MAPSTCYISKQALPFFYANMQSSHFFLAGPKFHVWTILPQVLLFFINLVVGFIGSDYLIWQVTKHRLNKHKMQIVLKLTL